MVLCGVIATSLEGLWVDIDGVGECSTEFQGGDGEDAGTAAVINAGHAWGDMGI